MWTVGGDMPVYALGDVAPVIDDSAYVHPDAVVMGNVRIGAHSSIWPGAILRGDRGAIVIGDRTSIQDGSVIHCNSDNDTHVGSRCVIGHLAHLEGCTIGADTLIGVGSIVLSGAVVGSHVLVGAGALVPPNRHIADFSRALGIPVQITPDAVSKGAFTAAVDTYVENAEIFRTQMRRIS
jgi:carbonic anhydrase/acetyltransferase-like protein (isoleucine patch superfamily)